MPSSDASSQEGGGETARAGSPTTSATAPPPPFERRPSLNGGHMSTRIYPIKSVAHPSRRARRNSAATSASGPLSPRPHSPVESVPSSLGAKPASLDPFLSEPTTHARAEVPEAEAEEGASSAGGSRQSDLQLFMSERFEHQEGEDGDHYIVTGRNGQIERCEDEVGDCRRSIRFASDLRLLTFRRCCHVAHPRPRSYSSIWSTYCVRAGREWSTGRPPGV